MSKLVCNYAPIRFLPYRDVGEFVTVGVVLHCPKTDFFGHRLLSLKKTGRITGFFPELDIKIFKAAVQGVKRDLEYKEKNHNYLGILKTIPEQLVKYQMARFQELVRRREGLIHFGEPGTILVDEPKDALNGLFERYVNRQFAQKREYQEIVMRKKLAVFLREWKLIDQYDNDVEVGDSDFHVTMPFAHLDDDAVVKVIKPLDLGKADSSDVYHHGGAWVKNMERLKQRGHMPRVTVFTVQLPASGKPLDAANIICNELRQLNVRAVEFKNTQQVRDEVEIR